jgi:hypothetical protein
MLGARLSMAPSFAQAEDPIWFSASTPRRARALFQNAVEEMMKVHARVAEKAAAVDARTSGSSDDSAVAAIATSQRA